MSQLSVFASHRAGFVEVAVKAYADGSGKTDDAECRFITLSGLIGSPDVWDEFEQQWASVLDRHSAPPWHSADAFAQPPRDQFVGWTSLRVLALQTELIETCLRGIAQTHDFIHASCTVNLDDYRRASEALGGIPETPEALCAFWIAHVALGWIPDDPDDRLGKAGTAQLVFDKGEKFAGQIQKEWESRKRNPDDGVSRIVSIGSADHRDVLGLQAADMLAWSTYRAYMTNKMGGMALHHTAMSWFAMT